MKDRMVVPNGSKRFLIVVCEKVACSCACCAAFCIWIEADDGAIDGASAAGIVPVLRPIVPDRASRPADVLEVGSAEIFMLLDVEPKVEDILCTLALEKETGGIGE